MWLRADPLLEDCFIVLGAGHPPDVSADAFAIALQHQTAGRTAEAEEVCRGLLQRHPGHAAALHLLGLLYRQRGRHGEALDLLRRSVQLAPTVADFRGNLAAALGSLGRHVEAAEQLRHAVRLRPGHPRSHHNLGVALEALGDLPAAEAALRESVRLDPSYALAHHHLGNVVRKRGRLGEAAECYRRAIALRPGLAEAHNNLGTVLQQLGRVAEAIACFRAASELDPACRPALSNDPGSAARAGASVVDLDYDTEGSCGGSLADSAYEISFDFDHTAGNLDLTFKGANGFGAPEAWGVAALTVRVDDSVARVTATLPQAAEGGSEPGRFMNSREGGSKANALTVKYRLSGAASKDNSDYPLPAGYNVAQDFGTVTIAALSDFATIDVAAVNDGVAETTENVFLTILDNAGLYGIAPDGGDASVNILDRKKLFVYFYGFLGPGKFADNWLDKVGEALAARGVTGGFTQAADSASFHRSTS